MDFFLDQGFVILVLHEDFFEDVTLGRVLGVGAGVDKGEATFSEEGAEVEAVCVCDCDCDCDVIGEWGVGGLYICVLRQGLCVMQ